MSENQEQSKDEQLAEETVKIVKKGDQPEDIWFEVKFESKYYRHPNTHKYISHFIFRNSDIKDICTELKGDQYEKQVVVVVSTKGKTYTFNETIGKKVMDAFKMVNCVATVDG